MTSRSKAALVLSGLIATAVLVTGCPGERVEQFEDHASPAWTYDQPFYYQPLDGPAALADFGGPAPELFTAKRLLAIPRPRVNDPRKIPRTAIWLSRDAGRTWDKIGYFGLQQEVFNWPVDADGDYGVRFAGPGIPPADCKPPKPHMVMHVDTTPPEVLVYVFPNKEIYEPGDELTVEWMVRDANLKPDTTHFGVCFDIERAELAWSALGEVHPSAGSVRLMVPDEAIGKILMVRVTAQDLAGNVGQGFSCSVPVVFNPMPAVPAASPTGLETPQDGETATQPAESGIEVLMSPGGPQIITTMPDEYPDLE